jgi:VanZ family protein
VTVARGRWIAAAVWAALVLVSGVVPTRTAVGAVSGGRDDLVTTAAHLVAYVVLGLLLAVAPDGWTTSLRTLPIALILAAALGGAIELVQGPLPYRDTQLGDFLVDVAGAAVGLAVFSAVAWVKRPRPHP